MSLGDPSLDRALDSAGAHRPRASKRTLSIGLEKLCVAAVLLLIGACVAIHFQEFARALGGSFFGSAPQKIARSLQSDFYSWLFYAILMATFILEWAIPARPEQRGRLPGLRQDLLATLLQPVWVAILIPAWVAALRIVYNHNLSFLTVSALSSSPAWIRIVLTLLIADLCNWVAHVARHKVPLMWEFHAMHHSQLEINFFTEQRIHPMDWIFVRLVRFVPMMMIAQSVTIVAIVEWSLLQYSRVYHANIRTNLGILRYVLVTPQSHRIHHSPYPQHQDKNFGVVFSIWDYLFGTQYHGYDEYPDTGIADTGFPREQSFGWPSTLFTLLRQYAYPFRRVARRWSTDS